MNAKQLIDANRKYLYLFVALLISFGFVWLAQSSYKNIVYQGRASSEPQIITPVLPSPSYYLKTSSWVTVDPNIVSTTIAECDAGDIAISGGLDGYDGPINVWRTVRSGPSNTGEANRWQVTVVNEGDISYQYNVTVKCLKQGI